MISDGPSAASSSSSARTRRRARWIHTSERFLYLVQGNNRAMRYGIGVGREGFQWSGLVRSAARRNGRIGAAAGDDRAPALSAALHGRRPGQSAGRARPLSRRHGLPHSWHQPAADDRPCRLVGLLPPCQRRRHRSLFAACRSAPRSWSATQRVSDVQRGGNS